MVGNDIVDLGLVDSPPYLHLHHLDRACTPAVSSAVRKASAPTWSLSFLRASKEAAFKILRQAGNAEHY